MKHVPIWRIRDVEQRGGITVVRLDTDGENKARCEPTSHALITWGDKVCPACYPASYPSVARHRKAIA